MLQPSPGMAVLCGRHPSSQTFGEKPDGKGTTS